MRGLSRVMLAAFAVSLLAACGEPNQSTRTYDGRTYSGKPDQQPWSSAAFDGDKGKWDRALADRARHQNEYNRAR